jgi:hypothetical protein
VSISSKSEFAPRLGQHAEGAFGTEHSSEAFCVLSGFRYRANPSVGGTPKRFKPDDARVRTVRHTAFARGAGAGDFDLPNGVVGVAIMKAGGQRAA